MAGVSVMALRVDAENPPCGRPHRCARGSAHADHPQDPPFVGKDGRWRRAVPLGRTFQELLKANRPLAPEWHELLTGACRTDHEPALNALGVEVFLRTGVYGNLVQSAPPRGPSSRNPESGPAGRTGHPQRA